MIKLINSEWLYNIPQQNMHACLGAILPLQWAKPSSQRFLSSYHWMCLKPTNTKILYFLAGIAPPDIRRRIVSHAEKLKQTVNGKHPLHGQTAAPTRLKFRKNFLSHVQPLNSKSEEVQLKVWNKELLDHPPSHQMEIQCSQSLPPRSNIPWAK